MKEGWDRLTRGSFLNQERERESAQSLGQKGWHTSLTELGQVSSFHPPNWYQGCPPQQGQEEVRLEWMGSRRRVDWAAGACWRYLGLAAFFLGFKNHKEPFISCCHYIFPRLSRNLFSRFLFFFLPNLMSVPGL